MAEKGKYIANFEYGRCPYAGIYIGNFEYRRCPAIGYQAEPAPSVSVSRGREMLLTKLPRKKFWTTDYPNLDPSAEGRPIPIGYGEIKDIKPICIDINQGIFLLIDTSGRAIKSVDAVRDSGNPLIENTDYSVNLDEATITLQMTPVLQPNTTYYIVIESDYTITGSQYLKFCQAPFDRYTDGALFNINDSGEWAEVLADLFFQVIVKDRIDGDAFVLMDEWNISWEGWNSEAKLRDSAARMRLAQSFKTPASGGPWYLHSIRLGMDESIAPPTHNTRIYILSNNNPETQVGAKSYIIEGYSNHEYSYFPQRAGSSDIEVDFKAIINPDNSLMTNVADILKDVYITILGGSESAIDSEALVSLKAARTEALSIWIDEEIQFQDFLQKLEAGQLFKFLPTMNFGFTVLYATSGEPSGTPHFRDEDFISFKTYRHWSSVFQKIKLKYNENPADNSWSVVEAESNEALYLYRNQKTLEIETYLTSLTDAQNYAGKYSGFLKKPAYIIEFETTSVKCLGLLPWQKIKITRSTADYSDGKLDGILFRILSISANPLTGINKIMAILDSQTY